MDAIANRASDVLKGINKKYRSVKRSLDISGKFGEDGTEEVKGVTIYLKHGGVISGKLLGKKRGDYIVEQKGDEFAISGDRIERIEYTTQKEAEWAYKNDIVVRKTNGIVLDGKISEADKNGVRLIFDEGEGEVEMGVERKDIDCLVFAPVYNKEGEKIEKRLKDLFPKMKIYREGNVVLFTDSHPKTAQLYRKTIREVYTDVYLKFFKAFKDRRPMQQNFVVVFDDIEDFAKYGIADFVPFWAILGYFDPTSKVLYLYNGWGARTEKFYYEWVTEVSDLYDKTADRIKDKYKNTSADIVIEGMAKELKGKYWDWYAVHRQEYTDETLSTLRHELTHEVFHNWGLQDVVLSKSKMDKNKLAAKQKEIMEAIEAKDKDKLEELFKEVVKLKKGEYEDLELEAAQSWLGEGVATYCATEPPGRVDEQWLYLFQEAQRKNEVNPIEFLTSFKIGSFPGLCPKAQINSYAESWAFTNFLMAKYPDKFMAYQLVLSERAADKTGSGKMKDQEDLNLLLKTLNKDLPTVEEEFRIYMATYPKAEDPFVKRFLRYEKIKEAYEDVFRRHGG